MNMSLSDDQFEAEVLKSSVPYLVEFWAPWCAPCKMMAVTIEAVAEKYGERLAVGKMNVDENQNTVDKFDIRGVPTLLFFMNGKVEEKFVGLVPRDSIERTLDFHL